MAFLRVRENSDALCRIAQLRMYRQAQPHAWAHSVGFRILSVFTNALITVWLAYSPILLITCFDTIDTSTPHVALVGSSSGSSQSAVLKRHYNALLCTVGHPARNLGPPRLSATMQTSFRTRPSANHLFCRFAAILSILFCHSTSFSLPTSFGYLHLHLHPQKLRYKLHERAILRHHPRNLV